MAWQSDRQAWPYPSGGREPEARVSGTSRDHERIRARPLCVATPASDPTELSPRVVYRLQRDGDRLLASYFLHWSSERPWDRSVAVALAIDAVYSHLLFVLPGLRYWLYGPGDVEGATVVYREGDSGLEIVEGFADDRNHQPTRLSRTDLESPMGTALMTRVWSHQLGAPGAALAVTRPSAEVRVRCFERADFVPLTDEIADRFRLGREGAPARARPAWR